MSEEVLTTEDVDTVISDIRVALDSLYKSDSKLNVTELHPLVAKILNNEDKSSVSERLKSLENEMTSFEPLNIAMSFVPSKELVRSIHSWMSKNVANKVILSLSFDSGLVGGCTLSYKGKYHDASLKRVLDDYFDKRENV